MDVDHLDELFGVRPEGKEAATVAGLVSELAGRIPQKGEVVEEDVCASRCWNRPIAVSRACGL